MTVSVSVCNGIYTKKIAEFVRCVQSTRAVLGDGARRGADADAAAGACAEAPRGERVWHLRPVRAGHRRRVERHTPPYLLLATGWLGHSAQDLRCARAR